MAISEVLLDAGFPVRNIMHTQGLVEIELQ